MIGSEAAQSKIVSQAVFERIYGCAFSGRRDSAVLFEIFPVAQLCLKPRMPSRRTLLANRGIWCAHLDSNRRNLHPRRLTSNRSDCDLQPWRTAAYQHDGMSPSRGKKMSDLSVALKIDLVEPNGIEPSTS